MICIHTSSNASAGCLLCAAVVPVCRGAHPDGVTVRPRATRSYLKCSLMSVRTCSSLGGEKNVV